jgi:hypothetical protein
LGAESLWSPRSASKGVSIICYNLQLESRWNDELRIDQLKEGLTGRRIYDSTQLVVVAGDLNLNASKSFMTDSLARAGFRDVVPTSRVPTTPARHLLEAGRHIDWDFVRGPGQADAGKVRTGYLNVTLARAESRVPGAA